MPNPWLKKNPLMSLWLSTANRMTGSMRARAAAQVKRQVSGAVAEATRDNLKLWPDAAKPALPKAKRRR